MYKRFSDLKFVIGLFFTLTAGIVLAGYLTGTGAELNLWSGLAFLAFGSIMMATSKPESE